MDNYGQLAGTAAGATNRAAPTLGTALGRMPPTMLPPTPAPSQPLPPAFTGQGGGNVDAGFGVGPINSQGFQWSPTGMPQQPPAAPPGVKQMPPSFTTAPGPTAVQQTIAQPSISPAIGTLPPTPIGKSPSGGILANPLGPPTVKPPITFGGGPIKARQIGPLGPPVRAFK